MHRFTYLIIFLVCCCQTERNDHAAFPIISANQDKLIVYEGVIPLDSGEELTIVLGLLPGSPGFPSYYVLDEWSAVHNNLMIGRNSANQFTTLAGSNADEVFIKLHNSRTQNNFFSKRASDTKNKNIKRTKDLWFKTKGNTLILVDDDLKEVNAERFNLIQRSKPFTVEGYITFVNDTVDFFEMNTRETWALADRGQLSKARYNYDRMATEKFEGIYLKGLAYTVDHISPDGREVTALVLRNIYDMHAGAPIQDNE
jgi:hypothetical protein